MPRAGRITCNQKFHNLKQVRLLLSAFDKRRFKREQVFTSMLFCLLSFVLLSANGSLLIIIVLCLLDSLHTRHASHLLTTEARLVNSKMAKKINVPLTLLILSAYDLHSSDITPVVIHFCAENFTKSNKPCFFFFNLQHFFERALLRLL